MHNSKVLIRKYKNRKLYNTQTKRYVTLGEITTYTPDSFWIECCSTRRDLTAKTVAYANYLKEFKNA